MPARPDAAALALIDPTAQEALPGILGQRSDGLFHAVVNRDAEPVAIHRRHLAMEIRSMVGASLKPIVLPLVNHLVRERADKFRVRLVPEQGRRKPDQAPLLSGGGVVDRWGSRAEAADEHPGGSSQPEAPHDLDRRQGASEVTDIKRSPALLKLMGWTQAVARWPARHAVHETEFPWKSKGAPMGVC